MAIRFKRGLYLTHRWAGVVLCAFFAMWFFSGVVMMYVGYPKLTPQERLAALPALVAADIRIGPEDALKASGIDAPQDIRLAGARAGRAVYRVRPARGASVVVDAATGAVAPAADLTAARATAQTFFANRYASDGGETIDEDVFTHSGALDIHRPLHRFDMQDPAHTHLYVSSTTGEVVLDATRKERGWNYVGAWIHWLYPFRGNVFDAYWHRIVVWLSVAGVVLTITGSIVGVMRWRFARPYASGSRSPYREPFMRWHHIVGLMFAAITFTWIFSGLMSMNPWKVFTSSAPPIDMQAYRGGQIGPDTTFAAPSIVLATLDGAVRELTWSLAAGHFMVQAQGSVGAPTVLDGRTGREIEIEPIALKTAVQRLRPHARIDSIDELQGYDTYYYARDEHAMLGHVMKPLPVWRIVFNDAHATWVYVDPHTAQIVQQNDGRKRVGRWLFAFLHSWDWLPLITRRPLWDIVLIALSLGGLVLSATGVVIGVRRSQRKWGRADRATSHDRR